MAKELKKLIDTISDVGNYDSELPPADLTCSGVKFTVHVCEQLLHL